MHIVDRGGFAGELKNSILNQIRKCTTIMLVLSMLLFTVVMPVSAWYSTPTQGGEAWFEYANNDYCAGKHGSLLEYGYYQWNSHTDTHPQFYAYLESIGDWATTTPYHYYPHQTKIKIWGYDPLGNPLHSQRFTDLSLMMSPDSDGTEIAAFSFLMDFLGDFAPEGVMAISNLAKAVISYGGSSVYREGNYVIAEYVNPGIWLDQSDSQRAMRLAFQLVVDPTLEGTYHINLEFYTRFVDCGGWSCPEQPVIKTWAHVQYIYDNDPVPGGCPILSVYDGNNYVEEGLLNIHASEDVSITERLSIIPALHGTMYELRLTEHPQTISHIDNVKLYGRLLSGTVIELPLVYAHHSSDNNVKWLLKWSDDVRVDLLGADHNDGVSEYIDLRFRTNPGIQFTELIFAIEGHNVHVKF